MEHFKNGDTGFQRGTAGTGYVELQYTGNIKPGTHLVSYNGTILHSDDYTVTSGAYANNKIIIDAFDVLTDTLITVWAEKA